MNAAGEWTLNIPYTRQAPLPLHHKTIDHTPQALLVKKYDRLETNSISSKEGISFIFHTLTKLSGKETGSYDIRIKEKYTLL